MRFQSSNISLSLCGWLNNACHFFNLHLVGLGNWKWNNICNLKLLPATLIISLYTVLQTQAWIQLTNGHLLHNNYLSFSVNQCVVALFSHLCCPFTRPDNYFSHSWPSWMHDSEIELAKLSNSVYQNEHQLNISTLQTCFLVPLITHFFPLILKTSQEDWWAACGSWPGGPGSSQLASSHGSQWSNCYFFNGSDFYSRINKGVS